MKQLHTVRNSTQRIRLIAMNLETRASSGKTRLLLLSFVFSQEGPEYYNIRRRRDLRLYANVKARGKVRAFEVSTEEKRKLVKWSGKVEG